MSTRLEESRDYLCVQFRFFYESFTDGQLSRPSKDFTPFGQKLRAELFRRLHTEREQRLLNKTISA